MSKKLKPSSRMSFRQFWGLHRYVKAMVLISFVKRPLDRLYKHYRIKSTRPRPKGD